MLIYVKKAMDILSRFFAKTHSVFFQLRCNKT